MRSSYVQAAEVICSGPKHFSMQAKPAAYVRFHPSLLMRVSLVGRAHIAAGSACMLKCLKDRYLCEKHRCDRELVVLVLPVECFCFVVGRQQEHSPAVPVSAHPCMLQSSRTAFRNAALASSAPHGCNYTNVTAHYCGQACTYLRVVALAGVLARLSDFL